MNRGTARIATALAGLPLVLLAQAAPAHAHPLGNLSVNTYDGVVIAPEGVRVDHVEDIAEVPSVAAQRAADADRDGTASASELEAWSAMRCTEAAGRIRLTLDGRAVPLLAQSSSAVTGAGQAGLATIRVECDLRADATVDRRTALRVAVEPPTDLGWREVTIAGDGVTIRGADVPSASVSARLTAYPGDITASPDERGGSATVEPGGPRLAAAGAAGPAGTIARGVDGLTTAVEGLATGGGPVALVLLVLGGLLLGALHALAPGHGKTVVAVAALAGQGARRRTLLRAAATLGASITAAHTASVLVVGVALSVLGAVVPAALFPALAVVAGALVVVVGIGLMRGRGAHVHGPGGHTHGDHDHDHHHDHGHDHDHDHDHEGHPHDHDGHGHQGGAHDDADHDHEHGASGPVPYAFPTTGAALLAVAPAPAAAAAQQRHDHDHHDHEHHDHDHHDHDHHDHETAPRRRTLVALGAVGGLTPSPTALVVLLGTLAVGRPLAGLLAVVAFGAGMALTLVGSGLLAIVLGRRAAAVLTRRGMPAAWLAVLPRLAGIAVVCAGAFLVARGAWELLG